MDPLACIGKRIDGAPQLLFKTNGEGFPTSAVPTGDAFVFTTFRRPGKGADIWMWAAAGPSEGTPLVEREFDQTHAQLSPDGKWIAYVSNETGRNEVYLAAFQFDRTTGRTSAKEGVPLTRAGGIAPRWRGDGRELFYLANDGWLMSVNVDATAAQPSTPAERLFAVTPVGTEWSVTRDGRRFLFCDAERAVATAERGDQLAGVDSALKRSPAPGEHVKLRARHAWRKVSAEWSIRCPKFVYKVGTSRVADYRQVVPLR